MILGFAAAALFGAVVTWTSPSLEAARRRRRARLDFPRARANQ